MNKKESLDISESVNELLEQLGSLLERHHKLNSEVDNFNTRIYSLSSQENDHLRHLKFRKLKLKDKIESMRMKLQLAE